MLVKGRDLSAILSVMKGFVDSDCPIPAEWIFECPHTDCCARSFSIRIEWNGLKTKEGDSIFKLTINELPKEE